MDDELSHTAIMLLGVLRWEQARAEAVTVEEVMQRLGATEEQAKRMFGELIERGLVDVQAAPAYRR